MTGDELKRLEALCASPTSIVSDALDMLPEELQPGALLAEIRRLRGLTERAEKTHLHPDLIGCPWCGARREGKNPEPHAAGCPAFTPDGAAR